MLLERGRPFGWIAFELRHALIFLQDGAAIRARSRKDLARALAHILCLLLMRRADLVTRNCSILERLEKCAGKLMPAQKQRHHFVADWRTEMLPMLNQHFRQLWQCFAAHGG